MSGPLILVPKKQWTKRQILKSYEDPGKPRGRSKGSYIAGDLSECKQTILLCSHCKHAFDWKRHHYYPVTLYDKIHARGKCDGCKTHGDRQWFYVHENFLGLSWTPRHGRSS
jgi:hypothetical protein